MPDTAVTEPEPEFVPPIAAAMDEPVGPSPLDQRESVIDEISGARLEMLREDGVDIPPEDGEAPGDGAEPTRELLPAEPLYTVKIDGQERQVPLSELTATYVPANNAREHLDQASQTLHRARETEQGVLARATAQAPPDRETSGRHDELSQINWDGLAERLQYGDKEDAAAALKETVSQIVAIGGGAPRGAAVTPEQIETRIFERVEWTTALSRFGDDYKDILKDHYVANVAGTIGRALFQQAYQDSQANGTPRRPYWDILDEAGEKTRDWLKGLGGQPADPSKPRVNLSLNRGERKRFAPQPPTPRSGVSGGATGRGKAPKSAEQRQREGIHDIQRARGQR